jgi:hypothetical protein
VLIDLTADTVDPAHLLSGITAHDASGNIITGSCTYDADTSDADATAAEILAGKTAYKNGSKLTGSMPNRGAQTGAISTKDQEITIQNGYHDGSGKIGIDATEKAKLIASNIRQGVTIFGVEGTMSGSEDVHAQTKTVTPYTTQQTYTPDTGYNYFTEFTVNAIAYTETENQQGGLTVNIGTVAPA